jgi:predicted phosphodiesterase
LNKIVVIPDVHTPNHNEEAIGALLDFIKFYKPNTVIQLGDFCDWDSVSDFQPSSEAEIQPIDLEIRSANELLDRLDKACGKAHKIMLGGNHEARLAKFHVNHGMLVGVRRMHTLRTWFDAYNLDKRGWEHYDYGKYVRIGKIIFTHGWQNFNVKRMGEKYPGRNVIFGHLHRHEVHGWVDECDRPIESETIGTLSKFDLSYLKGSPATNWVNGFSYVDMMDNGMFSKHFVHIIDGWFVEYGKHFGRKI